ncbi:MULTISPECIES: ParA family protein [Stenotrophomonas]|uniref:ParA family protein n=1 Tax=Stenotrophomonas TaxID=40323 RepID=UPI0021BF3132|nr:ParA family protein [Stenotrophomonas maltophilia]EKT4067847.1 ParA family protein [Stenotrophomonas maltophilia]UXL28746.1 ParA family protein [Stenotrophomonas maltophilia]HEL3261440.1 ParA family protein [Stenotrophomonas maltophilia]HEP1209244.1 ParA family protein [Stenotrophomonas maltophilia]
MGKVVTVMNMKGGVGKTTVALNVAGALGYYKWRDKPTRKVLIIDYDPQFNLSQAYIPPAEYFRLDQERKTILSVLQESAKDLDPYRIKIPETSQPPGVGDLTRGVFSYDNGSSLSIVPSTLDLMYVALGRAETQICVIEKRFSKFIDECRRTFDLVVIDCHPAGSLMTKTALGNSDHVLIPVVPERYAVRGIGLMLDFIESKKLGGHGPVPHILFNKAPLTGSTVEELTIRSDAKYSKYCMRNTLKRYKAFSEPEGGKGFVWHNKKPHSKKARANLQNVAFELAERTGVW